MVAEYIKIKVDLDLYASSPTGPRISHVSHTRASYQPFVSEWCRLMMAGFVAAALIAASTICFSAVATTTTAATRATSAATPDAALRDS